MQNYTNFESILKSVVEGNKMLLLLLLLLLLLSTSLSSLLYNCNTYNHHHPSCLNIALSTMPQADHDY